jgi:ATP-dependent helicase HrpB
MAPASHNELSADPLPVDGVIPALEAALAGPGAAVLQAPPGSGKTTRVPLALLDAPWLAGRKIIVLEPRRVAARAAARRLAANLGEDLGGRVGYRIRQDHVPGKGIEVVTEGILTRMLQSDPALPGVGAVVFDEFHERSIHGDLGLALSLDVRGALRPDLRLVVMSATLDTAAVAAVLDDAPVVAATVPPHPVTTVWTDRPSGRVDAPVARAVLRALEEVDGDVLAFLPGAGEIRSVAGILGAVPGVDVVPLHGTLPSQAQDAALRRAPDGRRKVVLATSIAETSVTIDGIRAVVDSGLMRVARFDPAAGMTRLVTLPVSKAAADQRQGRAGRQGPGVCYRLWSREEHAGLARATAPEILVADLAPLALELAEWGAVDPAALRWIDPPPAGGLAAARAVLATLGAVDGSHRITPHGRSLARLGVHPRLGHLLLRAGGLEAEAPGTARLASEIAAVLSSGRPLGGAGSTGADLAATIEARRRGGGRADDRGPDDRGRGDRGGDDRGLREAADRWLRLLGFPAGAFRGGGAVAPEDAGRLLALAYPDRVGLARAGRGGQWLLRNGHGAWVPEGDSLAGAQWVVAAELDGDRRNARIWSGAPLHPDDVERLFGSEMETVDRTGWDPRRHDVVASRERRLGAIVVGATPLAGPGTGAAAALMEGIRDVGLDLLPWTDELQRLRARVAFARRIDGPAWPDLSDEALLADLESWLAPWLAGRSRRADLAALPLGDALWQRVGWSRRGALEETAPTHLTLPTGARRRLDYPAEGPPTAAARVQELFGATSTPTVAGGRVPVLLHITSPAGRPVQVTSDLGSFWATTYRQVRAELRARYPRHPWPEDPLAAAPTSRAAPRRGP